MSGHMCWPPLTGRAGDTWACQECGQLWRHNGRRWTLTARETIR